MPCPRCKVRYAGGRPPKFASEPRCAFELGIFDPDNWQCRTANDLRDRFDQWTDDTKAVYNDDQWAAIIPLLGGRFLILGWYKSRGRTEAIFVLDETTVTPATLADCEEALREEPS